MAETYTAGYVTAYGAAVRGGYTGTYEEFCAEQAEFGRNAAAVEQAKADVETMQGQVEQATATFTGTTVPAAVATVQEAGAAQVQAVQSEGTMQAAAVETVGAQQTAAVEAAGSDAVDAVEAAETAATDTVTAAQTAAVQAVQTESTTQQAAIQTKGQETIDSIPSDYTALSYEVDDLKSSLTLLEDDQKQYLFNETVTGTVLKQINVSIPAGTYELTCDSVISSDTQYTNSRVTFFGSGGASLSTDIDRESGADKTITLSFDVTSIAFYGAHNYSDSSGVTFTYTNFRIISGTGISARFDAVESEVDAIGEDLTKATNDLKLAVTPFAFEETPGYYNEGGAVQTASPTYKEVYTNKIAVNSAQKVHWDYNPNDGTHNLWAAYMKYDADNNVIGTRVQLYSASATNASGDFVVPSGVAYISFTYRTFGKSNSFAASSYINVNSIKTIPAFPFQYDKFYGHLLINYVDESTSFERIIPCQSIFDVQMIARLGFRFIEANVQATATSGKYVVTHGISGKLGNDFETVGGENVGNVVIAETSYDDLRTNYRYRSKYAKYRVPITSLEEFLYECRTQNIFPVLQYVDEEELKIARGIVGDNLILYDGTRSVFDGYIMEYKSLTTEAQIVERCSTVGSPYMYCMGNPTAFTDVQLKSIIAKVHALGCYIGNAGTYDTPAENNRLMNLGFDFSASGGMVNDFANGNIINICDSPTFDGITTNGTISNGTLHLNEGQTVTFTHDSRLLIKFIMCLNFVGTLSINYPRKAGKTDNFTFTMTSDGTQDNNFSATLVERSLSVTLTGGTGGADIKTLSFKASEC